MNDTCEHGTPTSEDCPKCREILVRSGVPGFAVSELAAKDREIQRLKNIIAGCPVCSELERNIRERP